MNYGALISKHRLHCSASLVLTANSDLYNTNAPQTIAKNYHTRTTITANMMQIPPRGSVKIGEI